MMLDELLTTPNTHPKINYLERAFEIPLFTHMVTYINVLSNKVHLTIGIEPFMASLVFDQAV